MNEIEQLRQDIEKLEAAEGIIGNMCNENNTTAHMQRILKMQRQKLSRLEAEAAAADDPWREHKEVLSGRFHTQQGADHDEKLVLNYAMHLQQTNEKLAFKARLDAARIAELEGEEAEKADPWKYAKDAIPLHISNGGNRVSIVAKYAKHLEHRVAELEQHVAALKQAESIDIFDSKRAARQDARIAELEKQLASEKQQVHNVDSVVYVLSNDLKKAQARIAELEADNARLERSVAGYKTAGDHTADLMRYMLDRKEVISKPAGYEAINEMQRLDARIAELEKELAKRPVVWCVRIWGRYQRRQCGCVKTFSDWEKFNSPITQSNFEPYTGEQS